MDVMDEPLRQGFMEQLNFERYSAEVYLSMAWAVDVTNLTGFSKYLQGRAGEEREHAAKFSQYLSDRNLRPEYRAIPQFELPRWGTLEDAGLAVFQAALAHERIVTSRIHTLYGIAEEADDPSACVFLHWFITEQLEEEATLEEWVTRLTLAKGCISAYLAIDQEMRG